MFQRIAGLGFALSLVFTGAAVSPAKAFEKEVRSEPTSTVLIESAASADAGKKQEEVAATSAPQPGGAFSFIPLNSNVEVVSVDASEEEVITPQIAQIGDEREAAPSSTETEAVSSEAANNVIAFPRKRYAKAPSGAELVLAGHPAKKAAHDPRSGRLVKDASIFNGYWERLRRQRVADQEKRALEKPEENVPSLPSTSVEVKPASKAEAPTAHPNSPPNQAETDSANFERDVLRENKLSIEREGEALENTEEPTSPGLSVELREEVVEIEEPTSSPAQESEPPRSVQEEPDSNLENTLPADESDIDTDPLESIQEAETEEDAPQEVFASLGFSKIGSDNAADSTTFDVGIGYSQNDFGVETILKTPVSGGETAVDVELTAPLSERTSVSLKAEDLLSQGSTTLEARANIQALPNLILSPGFKKESAAPLRYNLGAALQIEKNLGLALEVGDLAATPVFDFEATFVQDQYEVVARANDLFAAETRTFNLETAIQIAKWAKVNVKLESIFEHPVLGTGLELQVESSTRLKLSINDTFGSQTYNFNIRHMFDL